MKKLLVVLLALIVTSTAFAAGGVDYNFFGLAMPETHVQRWIGDGNKLKAEAEKLGYRAEVQWANADQAIQNQQIEGMLTQGANIFIIGNVNDGVGAAVASARREGALVIAYDRIIQGTHDYAYFITFNNYKVGTLQGEGIVQGLNLKAATAASPKYITLFAGSPTDANANFFFQGAMDVLLPYINSGALVVVGPAPKHYKDAAFQQITTENWLPEVAKRRMEGLLVGDARNVTLDAVLAPNDTLARAILEACKADAKYRGKLPIVSGQDAEFDSALSIKNGEQYMTVFKDTSKLAEAAVMLADQLAKGQRRVNIPGAVVASGDLREIGNTGTGYVPTLLLDPILVTKDNLNVPVDAGFYTPAQAARLR